MATARRKSLSPSRRFRIFERDNFACAYCGRKSPDVELEVDHKIPVSCGGEDTESNLVTACWDCNRGKAAFIGKEELRNERDEDGWPLYVALLFKVEDKYEWQARAEADLLPEYYEWIINDHIVTAAKLRVLLENHLRLARGYAQRAANRFNREFQVPYGDGETFSPYEPEVRVQEYLAELRKTFEETGKLLSVVFLKYENTDETVIYEYKNDADCQLEDYLRAIVYHFRNGRSEIAQTYFDYASERFHVEMEYEPGRGFIINPRKRLELTDLAADQTSDKAQ